MFDVRDFNKILDSVPHSVSSSISQGIRNSFSSTFVSTSATGQDETKTPSGAFAACLAVLILDLYENDIKALKGKFRTWYDLSQPYITKHNIKREFDKIQKRFLSNTLDEQDLVEFGKFLGKKKQELFRKIDTPAEHLGIIQACFRAFKKDSPSSLNYLEKHISVLGSPELSAAFISEQDKSTEKDAVKASKKMLDVHYELTGRPIKNGFYIPPSEIQTIREKHPKLWDQYAQLSKVINAYVKQEVRNYVRSSTTHKMPIDQVAKHLESKGVYHNLPRGFIGGQVDDNYKFYTKEGRFIEGIPAGLMVMNPKYDPKEDNTYVMVHMSGNPKFRTSDFNKKNKEERHAVVQEFIDGEKGYRNKWRGDLSSRDEKKRILSAMVELLYATSSRIGGVANKTKGEPTYGLSTLRTEFVKVKPNEILFDYIGKKGAPQFARYKTNTPEGQKVRKTMLKLLEGKKKGDLVFETTKHYNAVAVNSYLRALGIPITAHKFRHIQGTKMANEILANHPFNKKDMPKESEVNKWFKEEMTKIGEVLHHRTGEKVTGSTAIKSYIDPVVIHEFYNKLGIRAPKFVPR